MLVLHLIDAKKHTWNAMDEKCLWIKTSYGNIIKVQFYNVNYKTVHELRI